MATVVKKNNRSQDEIRKSLGLPSGSSGSNTSVTAANPTSGNIGVVKPTGGGLSAPAGWYNQGSGLNVLNAAKNKVTGAKTSAQNAIKTAQESVVPSLNDIMGISSSGSSSGAASGFQRRTAPAYEEFEYEPFTYDPFKTSDLTNSYFSKMQEAEAAKPADYESKYEGAIQSILDGIMNRKSFDMNNDANYQALYNQYAQQYQAQADRAMRESLGNAAALSGGYGSTAATAAAGQAYDRAMEGLNNNNLALMQLAYQMYQDEGNNAYNQLGAVTGLENTDYARYRDAVGDYQNDRAYYANQYQNMYGNDWNKYAFETNMDWNNYQFGTNLDFQNHQAAQQRAWDDYALNTNLDWNEYNLNTNLDWDKEQYAKNMEYQLGRDALSDYDNAYNMALKMAQSGQQVPSHYASMLDPADVEQLNALAAQYAAQIAAGGSGGGGGGRGRSGSSKSSGGTQVYTGQPFVSQLGYDVNRNIVANAVNTQTGDQAKYDAIENAVIAGRVTPQQGLELIRSAGLNMNAVDLPTYDAKGNLTSVPESILNPDYKKPGYAISQGIRTRR